MSAFVVGEIATLKKEGPLITSSTFNRKNYDK